MVETIIKFVPKKFIEENLRGMSYEDFLYVFLGEKSIEDASYRMSFNDVYENAVFDYDNETDQGSQRFWYAFYMVFVPYLKSIQIENNEKVSHAFQIFETLLIYAKETNYLYLEDIGACFINEISSEKYKDFYLYLTDEVKDALCLLINTSEMINDTISIKIRNILECSLRLKTF